MHSFIFSPVEWIGQGVITFRPSPLQINFYTDWSVSEIKDGVIFAEQKVEKQGIEETTVNNFSFYDITPNAFTISLNVQEVGQVYGLGQMDEKTISWEFSSEDQGLIGKEVYTLQDDKSYHFHAEYSSFNSFIIVINGKIWQRN